MRNQSRRATDVQETQPRRRVAWSIYALAASMIAIVALVGYIVHSNRSHDRTLAQISLDRQADSNLFFESVCDKFELRDEIFLRILQGSYSRALERGEKVAAESLLGSIVALREAQGNCRAQIPRIRRPPDPSP